MVVVAGSDVGKHSLEVSVAEGRAKAFRNMAPGIGKLHAFLREQGAAKAVCEPTGGYERRMVRSATGGREAGFPVQPAHPNRVRAFARVCGYEAKTDLLDAQLLARYGRMFPEPEPQPAEPERQDLQDLLRRRQQLVAQRVQERNRLRQDGEATALQSTQRHIAWPDQEIAQLDQEYQSRLRRHAALSQSARGGLRTGPGVGPITRRHPGGRTAGTGPLGRQSPHRPGGFGALVPGQRPAAGTSVHSGRSRRGAPHPRPGSPVGNSNRRHAQRLLAKTAPTRQGRESRSGGGDAEAAAAPERGSPSGYPMAPGTATHNLNCP